MSLSANNINDWAQKAAFVDEREKLVTGNFFHFTLIMRWGKRKKRSVNFFRCRIKWILWNSWRGSVRSETNKNYASTCRWLQAQVRKISILPFFLLSVASLRDISCFGDNFLRLAFASFKFLYWNASEIGFVY